MFQLSSDITIGKFHFSGVHQVLIQRSIHSYVDTAVIKLPAKAQVKKEGKILSQDIVSGKQFTDGDPVIIKLGYNGVLVTEFEGFVVSRDLNVPLHVNCEGYSYQLKRNSISNSWRSITVAALLAKATAGTGITVQCTVDMTLVNLELKDKTGAGIIDTIVQETDGNLCLFFTQPRVLWCGLAYTACARGAAPISQGTAKYRLGYNAIRDNSLKQRIPADNPGTHIYVKKKTDGTRLQGQSANAGSAARTYKKALNRVADAQALAALAQEHQYRENYTGYEGGINAFLQPHCVPGSRVWISNGNYPERDGWYLAEGMEVTFGVNGARRKIDAGPLITDIK